MTSRSSLLLSLLAQLEKTSSPVMRHTLLATVSRRMEEEGDAELPLYLRSLLDLSVRLNLYPDLVEGSERLVTLLIERKEIEEGCRFCSEMLDQFPAERHAEVRFRLLLLSARLERVRSRFARGIRRLNEAEALLQSVLPESSHIPLLKERGEMLTMVGDHAGALRRYLHIVSLLDAETPSDGLGLALTDIALAHAALGDLACAISFLKRGVEQFNATGNRLLEVRGIANLSALYAAAGEAEPALDCGMKAMMVYEELHNRKGLAVTLINLSDISEREGNVTTATEFRLRALDLFEEIEDVTGTAETFLRLGITYASIDRLYDAQFVLEQGMLAGDAVDGELRAAGLRALADVYEQIGDHRRALDYTKEWIACQTALEREEQVRASATLQVRFELEQMRKEQEILRLKAERSEEDVRRKQAELQSVSLQLIERERLIHYLLERIEPIEQKARDTVKPLIREIMSEIRKSLHRDGAWHHFERQYEHIDREQMRRLAVSLPELTQTDLKHAALAVAGLSTGEIASVLGVTTRTVETTRFRIRKKYDVPKELDFSVWLRGVGAN